MPTVSLVLVFNSLLLWTLITVSVEWARHRELSVRRFARTMLSVVTNPVVAGILIGTAFGFTGLTLPGMVDATVHMIGEAAIPMSLIVLGMGLSEYGVRTGWRQSLAIAALKLAVTPFVVYLIARALALPPVESVVVVVMASLPVGANVYLMAREFNALEGPVASSLVLTTALAAVTTPLLLALLGVLPVK
jgi:predicted permease